MTFNITKKELKEMVEFSAKHGHHECGAITVEVDKSNGIGDVFTVTGEDDARKDIAYVDCW